MAKSQKYYKWQYFVPGVEAGLVEISNPQGLRADKAHVRRLLNLKLHRKRLPDGTIIFPYYSFGGALLRERASAECLRVDDRFEGAEFDDDEDEDDT